LIKVEESRALTRKSRNALKNNYIDIILEDIDIEIRKATSKGEDRVFIEISINYRKDVADKMREEGYTIFENENGILIVW